MSQDGRDASSGREGFREGVRSVTGLLGALKDALEASFDDLRGDDAPSADRPADATAHAFRKAQEAAESVRERFDFVSRREFDALQREDAPLRARVDRAGVQDTPGPAAAPAGDEGPPETRSGEA